MPDDRERPRGRNSWAYWLLLIPFVALLWVPFYNSAEPRWQGSPISTGTSSCGS